MRQITLALDVFAHPEDRKRSESQLRVLLAALYAIDVLWLRSHPQAPDILHAGVRYTREPLGVEVWQDYARILQSRAADCEDLACARAAWLTVRRRIAARPLMIVADRKANFFLYHIVVQLPDGRIEDPSRELGMGGPSGKWKK